MFKITSLDKLGPESGAAPVAPSAASVLTSHFCATEPWSGNLSNGLIKLGELGTSMHGLSDPECGLLTLIRCYVPEDRHNVLHILERATTENSAFCYSTMIQIGNDVRRPVFCVGESTGLENSYSGIIHGVFIFPNFKIQGRISESAAQFQ